MSQIFTEISFQNISNVANRYHVSVETTTELTHTLMATNGTMAQFYLPELGGGGQWMQGGMTMVGDMFNNQLRSLVDGLCNDLSNLIGQGAIQYKPLPKIKNADGSQSSGTNWWGDLGFPNSTGSQNGTSYAIFNGINRLAIQENGKVTVFDTLDHQIGGVGQQQGGNYSVSFSSQYGNVNLSTLPIVSGNPNNQNNLNNQVETIQSIQEPNIEDPTNNEIKREIQNTTQTDFEEDIFAKIEKLASLKDKGILSEDEFTSKKTELLSRL
ncbi:SHOCT domain-containing protein [Tamlana sp. 2_MG-2023]|uniref:SHOCT domain-containing protein n=1 Tax=unclassified Tamlana TaxID=2614803 RepID=UPI0026E32D74|nr:MULTISPECIES: SHOCT domain-containing protein [unclassified Tamlana]MDO6761336.1 SHOCT domain-containing protein [Tamlana sp. 2_MG-2023]MDO6791819.1 SHOCT domain-containing protein [Tamlana sp. 1_MG-2023]